MVEKGLQTQGQNELSQKLNPNADLKEPFEGGGDAVGIPYIYAAGKCATVFYTGTNNFTPRKA